MGQGAEDMGQRWASTGSEHGSASHVGVTHVKARMMQAPNLAALRRLWEGFNPVYQRHPEVMKLKDDLKKVLK